MAASVNLFDSLRLLVVSRYIDMAAGCLVIFDSLLVLDLEIEFIWKSKWSIVKVIYFINRYITLLDFILVYFRATITDTTRCPSLMKAEGVLFILGIYLAEYMFAMRTYIIWQKRKIIWIPLCLFYVAMLIFNFISYYSMLNHARYFLLPSVNGCLVQLPPDNLWVDLILLTAYDAAMIILIGWAATDNWKNDVIIRSDLLRVLYGEGILFYIYLLAFSITMSVTLKVFEPYLLLFMGRCVRSILASRVILHIREIAHYRGKYPVLLGNTSLPSGMKT